MKLIDSDALKEDLLKEYNGIAGYRARIVFHRAIDIVGEQQEIIPPPNDPLTMEELRKMDGEPVYLDFVDGGEWVLVRDYDGKVFITHKNTICSPVNLVFRRGGKIYRRKPEEGET